MDSHAQLLRNLVLAFGFLLFLPSCMYYYQLFGVESKTFTKHEKKILEKSTGALQFDYGYDDDLDLDYIYPYPNSLGALHNNEKKFVDVIDDIDNKTLIAYYEKIWALYQQIVIDKERFEKRQNWKQYTYITKQILPATDEYVKLLEKQVVRRDQSYAAGIDGRKKAIREQMISILKERDETKRMYAREIILRQRK